MYMNNFSMSIIMKHLSKAKKTKKKSSKVQSLVDETMSEKESLEQEITKAITKRKQSKSVVELDKKVASLSKADQKKYAREVEKTIQKKKKKKRIRSGANISGANRSDSMRWVAGKIDYWVFDDSFINIHQDVRKLQDITNNR